MRSMNIFFCHLLAHIRILFLCRLRYIFPFDYLTLSLFSLIVCFVYFGFPSILPSVLSSFISYLSICSHLSMLGTDRELETWPVLQV